NHLWVFYFLLNKPKTTKILKRKKKRYFSFCYKSL
ncbi:unnamed protein product, partial [Staurois parvus]